MGCYRHEYSVAHFGGCGSLSAGTRTEGTGQSAHGRSMDKYRRTVRHSNCHTLHRQPSALASFARIARVVRGDIRHCVVGAVDCQNPSHQGFRFRGCIFLGDSRPYRPQLLPHSGLAETCHSGRVLHQNRCGMSRCNHSVPRCDAFGQHGSVAGNHRGYNRLADRILHRTPHEGR